MVCADIFTSFVVFISGTSMSAVRSSPKSNKDLLRPFVVQFCCSSLSLAFLGKEGGGGDGDGSQLGEGREIG